MANETRRVKLIGDVTVGGTRNLEKTAAAAKRVGNSMKDTAHHTRSYDRATKGAAKASSNSSKNFAKNAQITEGLVPAYARLAAQVFAVSAAFQFLKDAGDLAALREGQLAYANATGIAMRSLTKDIKAAAGAQISFRDAAQAAAIGTAAGLNPAQLTDLGKAAKDTSLILGRDVTDSFNRLVRGVTKAEPELLDELGIILRLRDATEKYKEELGIQGELSQFQRSQAVTRDVLGQVEEKYSKILEVTDPAANSFNRFAKSFDSILDKFKEFINLLGAPIADFFADNISALVGLLGLLAVPIIKEVIPGLQDWAVTAKESSETARASMKKAVADAKFQSKQYSVLIKNDKQVLHEMQQTRGRMASILGGAGVTGRSKKRGSALARTLIDPDQTKDLTQKDLGILRKYVDKGVGEFKRLSAGQRAEFSSHLDDMSLLMRAHGKQQLGVWQRVTGYGRLSIARIQAAWASGIAAIKTATLALARTMNFVFMAAGWIGGIVLVVGMLKEAAQAMGFFNDELTEAEKRTQAFKEKFTALNKEFEKFNRLQVELGANRSFLGLVNFGNLLTQLPIETLGEFLDQTKSALKDVREIQKQAEAIGDKKFLTGGFTLSLLPSADEAKALKDLPEAQQEALKMFRTLERGIVTTGAEATKAGLNLKGLLQTIREGGDVTAEALKRAIEGYRETSAAASTFKQLQTDIATGVSGLIESTLPVSETDSLLTNLVQSKKLLTEQLVIEGANAEARAFYNEQLEQTNHLLGIVRQFTIEEQKIAISRLVIENKFRKAVVGATPFLKEQLEARKEMQLLTNDIRLKELEIKRTLDLAAERSGNLTETERLRLERLRLQLQAQKDQLGILQEQETLAFRLQDSFRSSFESGFEEGLANLVKNKEGSLTQSLRKLAISVLESLADTLVKDLTTKLSEALFKKKGPAASIWEALVNGGKVLYDNITAALAGRKVRPTTTTTEQGGATPGSATSNTGEAQFSGGLFSGLLNTLSGFFKKFMEMITGFMGGGGGIASAITSFLPFANGGIATGGFQAFANGGTVDRPTVGLVGEGRYNEAVVPLPDGKSIPVMGAGGNQQNNVEVNVSVDNQGNAQTSSTFDSRQAGQLGGLISTAVKEELQKQKRPGGILSPYGAA